MYLILFFNYEQWNLMFDSILKNEALFFFYEKD